MAWISSDEYCTVSIPSVSDATPPPTMTLIKSAPALSSSRVALRTAGTPSAVRPRLAECPPQHPVLEPPLTPGPKSPCPPGDHGQ